MADDLTAVRECALTLPRIDTHSHVECGFPSLEEEARALAGMMETTPGLIAARVVAEGCRVLYGIDPGAYLTPDGPAEIFALAAALRARGASQAFETALDTAHITRQFAFTGQVGFQEHMAENCPLRAFSSRIDLLAYLDPYITAGNDRAFTPDGRRDDFSFYSSLCGFLGPLPNLDAYLAAIDTAIDGWRQHGVVGLKIGLAYTTGLNFAAPTPTAARAAFARGEAMTAEEVRTVQDYAVHHALAACLRHHFPVVIHTGFLIWGHGDLRQANPMLLHPLLADARYRDLTFVLLHGGAPAYVGETTYLAGVFPNVIIDFTWMSWMQRTRFRQALAEWLEVVPPTRFVWGSDSGSPENIVGIDSVTRHEIADTLSDLITRRILDERASLRFLEASYRETARRVFGVEL